MWVKNNDDGKWYNEKSDVLPENIFSGLEQDISSITLYSKALSGSTYTAINTLSDIYDVLDTHLEYNWYVSTSGSTYSIGSTPSSYPMSISDNSEEYSKFIY